ncbi:MAG: hypothetical protein HY059_17715 [Proteobacteria bacterium]|nr:hypothetical protein [Pseudomonadota bacterium]
MRESGEERLARLEAQLREIDFRPADVVANVGELEELRAEAIGRIRKIRSALARFVGASPDRLREALRLAEPGSGTLTIEDLAARRAEAVRKFPLPVVFLHNRKAAGTTVLNHFVRSRFVVASLQHHTDRLAFNYDVWPFHQPPSVDGLQDLFWMLNGLASGLPGADRIGLVLTGHMALSHDIFRILPMPSVRLTVLREPVDYLCSLFRFVRRHADPVGRAIAAGEIDIVAFARRFAAEELPGMGFQFRHFATPGTRSAPDVGTSLANLEKQVTLFGLADRIPEFLDSLARLLPTIEGADAVRMNATDGIEVSGDDRRQGVVASADPLDPESRAAVEAILAPDLEFYSAAKALYWKSSERLRAL